MGVFEDLNRPYIGEGAAMKASLGAPCKPDYEKMIVAAKEKQDKTKSLISALQNYLLPEMRFDGSQQFTISGLIGRLVLEDLEYDLAIERLIEQQEAKD